MLDRRSPRRRRCRLFDIGTDTKVPITDSQGLEYYVFAARVADGLVVRMESRPDA